ncbi:putative ATP-dependent DNA helicase HFM1-like protein [Dinothrombium tinctorium]|uniref:DNA 3'-5' helicase n=1 Tax=Dinothrombium tinctorium TaxID=1965070 RepID=A0A443RQU9_9ACAR|nr:putative ATP-dependent DNA helicase HFM1-like protein [Dinothrombium tinctorium]
MDCDYDQDFVDFFQPHNTSAIIAQCLRSIRKEELKLESKSATVDCDANKNAFVSGDEQYEREAKAESNSDLSNKVILVENEQQKVSNEKLVSKSEVNVEFARQKMENDAPFRFELKSDHFDNCLIQLSDDEKDENVSFDFNFGDGTRNQSQEMVVKEKPYFELEFGSCDFFPNAETTFSSQRAEKRAPLMQLSQSSQFVNSQSQFQLPKPQKTLSTQTQRKSSASSRLISIAKPIGAQLRSINSIPEDYRSIFTSFEHFNDVQSAVLDDALFTDKSLVVSSPTGSGKTVIFELAIIRLLMNRKSSEKLKILFMAPLKVICSEKFADWSQKFTQFGLKCLELTGDTETEDYNKMEYASIIFTTPEKWDSTTRKRNDYHKVAQEIRLVLIDEVHCINDDVRGATIEAVVSRMKTMKVHYNELKMRFVAVSATIPNAEDIAEWLEKSQSVAYHLSESHRPVPLTNVVKDYPCPESWSDFRFDYNLNYQLFDIIKQYSDDKSTLIFAATRKSALDAAEILAQKTSFVKNPDHRRKLSKLAAFICDSKLKNIIHKGIAFHHGGLNLDDRRRIEEAFRDETIVVLISTTTLAMGVNLPAHLVIVKSTFQYLGGQCVDYSESHILQMIGRAGRPQFDTSAVAVIMTKTKLKQKYEKLVSGTKMLESHLHKHLVEHLNAEIVLRTITDVSVAMEWIRSTFLYIRLQKNKSHYGIDNSYNKEAVEKKVQQWCIKELNALKKYGMITMDEDCCDMKPTVVGCLMAHFCISLDSMRKFIELKGNETIQQLITVISSCEEIVQEIQLRVSDKQVLNSLNFKDKLCPENEKIRFPFEEKFKTREMKVNCLIQAAFGCLNVSDSSLYQDMTKIIKRGQRISKCLAEYLVLKPKTFTLLLNAITLAKCFHAQLWDDSIFVSKQLPQIGVQLSRSLVNAGLTSFELIEKCSPQQLNMYVNRKQPFGEKLLESVKKLPKYKVEMEQIGSETTDDGMLKTSVKVILQNSTSAIDVNHSSYLLIGNLNDEILVKHKLFDRHLAGNSGEWKMEFICRRCDRGDKIFVRLISEKWVGVDVARDFYPAFSDGETSKYFSTPWINTVATSAATSDVTRLLQSAGNNKRLKEGKNYGKRKLETILKDASRNKSITNTKLSSATTIPSVKKSRSTVGPIEKFLSCKIPHCLLKTEEGDDDDQLDSDPELDHLVSTFKFETEGAANVVSSQVPSNSAATSTLDNFLPVRKSLRGNKYLRKVIV